MEIKSNKKNPNEKPVGVQAINVLGMTIFLMSVQTENREKGKKLCWLHG